jgi:bacillithiol system protein YtxJ
MNIFKNLFGNSPEEPESVTIESFNELIETLSDGDHLLIYKASPRCVTSLIIEQIFDEWFQKNKSDNLKMLKVNVIAQRPISNFIAGRYSVKHESPQLIWLDHEENVLWQGSHGSITIDVLDELLNKHLK